MEHLCVEVGLDRYEHHVAALYDLVVVRAEGDPPLLPPGLEPAAGGAHHDAAGGHRARGQEPVRDGLGHVARPHEADLGVQRHVASVVCVVVS